MQRLMMQHPSIGMHHDDGGPTTGPEYRFDHPGAMQQADARDRQTA